MKTPENNPPADHISRQHLPGSHQRKGVALILVISFVVLLSALVVGFFSRVTTDLASSRSYAEGVTVRQLADSAVGVVMGQIREATTVQNGCWGSQPGMIRVYRTSSGQPGSDAYAFYKLYSSNDLIVSGREISQFDPTLTTSSGSTPPEVPLGSNGWKRQPAIFTDLNEPVDVPDPSAPSTARTIKRYPIFDPAVAAIYEPSARPSKPKWKVEGCEIALSSADRQGNDAPMPVRWVYVLKDGTLTAPPNKSDDGLKATWKSSGASGSKTGVPTKENPIVGRVAFWTDDETCKVNINTAGGFLLPNEMNDEDTASYIKPTGKLAGTVEKNPGYYAGSFWDTPRVQTYFDRGTNSSDVAKYRGGLANSQPGQNEFQRYPGHPSTTSLGLVMKYLLPTGTTDFNSEKLYSMTPRLTPGGSKNGTVRLDVKVDLPLDIKSSYESTPVTSPPTPSYHLFSSVDEFFWTAKNGPRKSAEDGINEWVTFINAATAGKDENPLKANTITPTLVDQARFFLTAHSRTPELNLFGRPRVTMWPVPELEREKRLNSYKIRNAKDDLIRFCSTVGRDPNANKQAVTRQGEFIFDRRDPYSSTVDFNLPRNKQIFAYLRELTSSSKGVIPGFGGSFEMKYASGDGGRDQILTEIFDYIRTINQKDGSRERTIDEKTTPNTTASALANADDNSRMKTESRYAPHGLVVPTRTTVDGKPVSGFGRYPTITEASLVFYHGGYICVPKKGSDLAKLASGEKQLTDTDPYKGGDLKYRGGVGLSSGNRGEVVIYDLEKFNDKGKDGWVEQNVQEWTGQIIRAFIVFETFNPMQGYAPTDSFNNVNLTNTKKIIPSSQKFERYYKKDPNFGVYVHELELKGQFTITPSGGGGPQPLNFGGGTSKKLKNEFTRTSGGTHGGRDFGGTEGFLHTMYDDIGLKTKATNFYKFQTPCEDPLSDGARFPFTTGDATFDFSGGDMDLSIRYEDKVGHNETIQTVKLKFPKGSQWPVPTPTFRNDTGGFDPRGDARLEGKGADSADAYHRWSTYLETKFAGNPLPSGWGMGYHLPSRIAWSREYSYNPWTKFDKNGKQVGDGYSYTNRIYQILQPGDTIRSLIVGGDVPAASDPRVAALQQEVTTFEPHPDYDTSNHRAQTLRLGNGGFYFDPSAVDSKKNPLYAEPPSSYTEPTTGSLVKLPTGTKYRSGYGPDLPRKTKSGQLFVAARIDGNAADFDTGIGLAPDGGFANKADEGNVAQYWEDEWGVWQYVEPYFTWVYDNPLDTYFSPNRQAPGPGMFGSLSAPNDKWSKAGWKTLLFCPNPASATISGPNHPGAISPHDHLLLDLFNMPVVEPYAISEPFSTAGKVNLNYQIVPFGYIKRTTALRAALHPLRVTAIPQTFTRNITGGKELRYKGQDNDENLRYLVDREETLKAFDAFFDRYKLTKSGGFFKSASQICERYLYPKGQTVDGSNVKYATGEAPIKAFWNNNQLTGDNVREKPYSDLYPRITTKSNTYTVHYRVQTLRQRPYSGNAAGADAHYGSFDEGRDQVLSEYRGQTTIERYLDPEDPRFSPTYQPAANRINVETQSLEEAYRFRIISNKRFSPW